MNESRKRRESGERPGGKSKRLRAAPKSASAMPLVIAGAVLGLGVVDLGVLYKLSQDRAEEERARIAAEHAAAAEKPAPVV